MKKLFLIAIVLCASLADAQQILPPILKRKPVASGSSTSNSPVLVTNLVIVPTGSPIVVR